MRHTSNSLPGIINLTRLRRCISQRRFTFDAIDSKMYNARMHMHFFGAYVCMRVYVLTREREYCWQYFILAWSCPPFPYLIITRHLLRHNTYFNWGLRAAAHTTHQSRRFIRNSRLPARHPPRVISLPFTRRLLCTCFRARRATRCGDTRRRILDQDFADLSESKAECTDFSTVIRDAKAVARRELFGSLIIGVSPK